MLKKHRKFCRHGLTHFDATTIVQIHIQGRSTVKGQMGHVSTSFCVSKENFDQFWEQTLKESKELSIEDPKLKRKEKIPKNS